MFETHRLKKQLKKLPAHQFYTYPNHVIEPLDPKTLPNCRLKRHLQWRNQILIQLNQLTDEHAIKRFKHKLIQIPASDLAAIKNRDYLIKLTTQLRQFIHLGELKDRWQHKFKDFKPNTKIAWQRINLDVKAHLNDDLIPLWANTLKKTQSDHAIVPATPIGQHDLIDAVFDPLLNSIYQKLVFEQAIDQVTSITELVDLTTFTMVLWATIDNLNADNFSYWGRVYFAQAASHDIKPFAPSTLMRQGLVNLVDPMEVQNSKNVKTMRGLRIWQFSYQRAGQLTHYEKDNPFLYWPKLINGQQIVNAIEIQQNRFLNVNVDRLQADRKLIKQFVKGLKYCRTHPTSGVLVTENRLWITHKQLLKANVKYWMLIALNMSNHYYQQQLNLS